MIIHTTIKETEKELAEDFIYRIAFDYVKANLGESFKVVSAAFLGKTNDWRFDIYCQFPDLNRPILAGQLKVNVSTGAIIPLTADELWDIQGRAETRAEHQRGKNPARDKNGLLLPYQAKIKVNAYMGGYVAFYASADGQPVFISGDPPVWRVKTILRLHQHGSGC